MPRDLALLDDLDPRHPNCPPDQDQLALFRELVQQSEDDGERSVPFLGIVVGLLLSAVLWTVIGLTIWCIV